MRISRDIAGETVTEGQSSIMTKQFLFGVQCTRGQLLRWRGSMSRITLPYLVSFNMNSLACKSLGQLTVLNIDETELIFRHIL